MKPTHLLVLLLSVLLEVSAWAANGAIVHAARRLRMSYTEPLPAKEFHVNLGIRHGVKVGDQLTVMRNRTILDYVGDSNIHVTQIPLGTLEVIAVADSACIALERSVEKTATLAVIAYPSFMVGDEVLAKTGLPLSSPIP